MTDTRTGPLRDENGDALCPEHGDTLGYHRDQGDDLETREHLKCSEPGCDYEVWA